MHQIESIFGHALSVDSTLETKGGDLARLKEIGVQPKKFRRETLFRNIARGEVSLFHDFPAPVYTPNAERKAFVDQLLRSLKQTRLEGKIRTSVGEQRRIRYLTPGELVARWQRNRAPMNVTDFHIRDTPIEKIVNPAVLSQFNFLPGMSNNTAWLEMMTMVMSSEGGFSDSHSDDCDGSNHCFAGKKLWLAWDTKEGIDAGLEDLDQQRVVGSCAFDFATFLQLSSACWITVAEGQTLFMPGHLTHKVITLEPYLGVGSFYIGFPNVLRTLSRWQEQLPNWQRLENQSLCKKIVPEILNTALRQARRIAKTSVTNQHKWGLDYSGRSVRMNKQVRIPQKNTQSDTSSKMRELEKHYLAI